jgi:hypothetical protein
LVTDHLDNNSRNNVVTNLVPACIRCNTKRQDKRQILISETYVTRKNGTRARSITRTCQICRIPFQWIATPSLIKRDAGKFCSRACYATYRRATTACRNGHIRTAENTMVNSRGHQICLTCFGTRK